MDRYLFVVCSNGIPITLEDFQGSDGFLAAAQRCLDKFITLATLFVEDPVPDLYCEVWQYAPHDEMKKIITVF